MSETDLVLTELRKAIKVEPGDYIVVIQENSMSDYEFQRLGIIADELWRENIRLHTVLTCDVNAIRFVRVESPETIRVETE